MASSFTVEAFTLLSLGIMAIALRTFSRARSVGLRGFQFDDYLMLGAAVIYSFETATAYVATAWWLGLANNGMTDEERKAVELGSHEYSLRVGGSKTQLVGWCLYTLLLWMLKLCMCGFYSRLTSGIHNLELRVKMGFAFIAVTYLATKLSILLGCQPYSNNWRIYPNPGNYCQPAISNINLYVTVVLNVTTDLYLLSIPIPMLWNAKLHLKGKLSLILVFGAGVFVMIAGILRCVVIIKDPTNGIQTATSWALRETFIATLLTNAPMIHPLLLHGVDKASSYHSSTSDRATGSVRLHSSFGSHPALRSATTLPTMACNPNNNDVNDNDDDDDDDDDDDPPAPPTRPRNRSSANRLSAILATNNTTTNRLSALLTRTTTNNSNNSTKDLTDRDASTKTTATRNRSSSRLSSLLLNIAESTTRSDADYDAADYADDLEMAAAAKRSRSRSRSRAASAASWRPTRPRSASPAASSALSMGGIMVKKEAVVSSEERTSMTTTAAATTTGGVSSKHSPSSSSASNGELLPAGTHEGGGGVEVVQLGERYTLRPEEEGLEYTAFVGRGDGRV